MLTEKEKKKIQFQYRKLKSYVKTAEKCKVSKNTVVRVIKNLDRKTGKKMGRPKKVHRRQLSMINKFVKVERKQGHRITGHIIEENFTLDCSNRTIRRALAKSNLSYKNVPKSLPLTDKHKQARLNFATQHVTDRTDFSLWIFTDEKRFSLDGPDSWGSWCTEGEDLERKKHQSGGGSIMILGAISSNGNLTIKVSFFALIDIIIYCYFVFRKLGTTTNHASTKKTYVSISFRGAVPKCLRSHGYGSRTTLLFILHASLRVYFKKRMLQTFSGPPVAQICRRLKMFGRFYRIWFTIQANSNLKMICGKKLKDVLVKFRVIQLRTYILTI